jgi:UDP-glucose 4-epimerase
MRRVPDTTLSQKLLGVKARVSVDDGLTRTIEWQRNFTRAMAAAAPKTKEW